MAQTFFILLIVFMLATLAVLGIGMVNFVRGGNDPEASSKRSNKLMMWRVVFQGLALLMLLGALASRGA